ncbi:MAG: hypothetical protein ACE5HD_01240 [Acidobacteriota bacterium]
MWTVAAGLAAFTLGVILLLVLISPKGEDRPCLFSCQRCARPFESPPLHPLPERYQEEEICLCPACGSRLEEQVVAAIRRVISDFLERAAR